MNKKKKLKTSFFISILCIGLPLLGALLFTFSELAQTPLSFNFTEYFENRRLQKAFTAYQQNELQKSKDEFEKILEITSKKQGCELSLSTYAKLGENEKLAKTALKCIKKDKAHGISHEALALSYQKKGQSKKALSILEEEAKRLKKDRIYGALARLYLVLGNKENASKNFLLAFKSSSSKWLWAHQALKEESLKTFKPLLLELSSHYITEKAKLPKLAKNLEKLLRQARLNEQANKMKMLAHFAEKIGAKNKKGKVQHES